MPTLDDRLLPASLVAPAHALLATLPFDFDGAEPGAGADATWVEITPLNGAGVAVPVQLTCSADGKTFRSLRIPIHAQPVGLGWALRTLFPGLPSAAALPVATPDAPLGDVRRPTEEFASALAVLDPANVAVVLSAAEGTDPDTGAPLRPGINIVSTCDGAAFAAQLGPVERYFAAAAAQSVGIGAWVVQPGDRYATGAGDRQTIWLVSEQPELLPGLHLRAALARTAVRQSPALSLGWGAVVPLVADIALESGPVVSVNAGGRALELAALAESSSSVTLAGAFSKVTLLDVLGLPAAFGGADPEQWFPDAGLWKLLRMAELRGAAVTLAKYGDSSSASVSVRVGVAALVTQGLASVWDWLHWSPPITDAEVGVAFAWPPVASDVDVTLRVRAALAGGGVDVSIRPQARALRVALVQGTISLAKLFDDVAALVSVPDEIRGQVLQHLDGVTVDQLGVEWSPEGWAFAIGVASDPVTTIVDGLALHDVEFSIAHAEAANGAQAHTEAAVGATLVLSDGGTIALGGALGDGLQLAAHADDLSLLPLVSLFGGESLFPDGLRLTTLDLTLSRGAGGWKAAAAGTMDGVAAAIAATWNGTTWGVAAGFAIGQHVPPSLAASVQGASLLDQLLGQLRLDGLSLVASTYDGAQIQLPSGGAAGAAGAGAAGLARSYDRGVSARGTWNLGGDSGRSARLRSALTLPDTLDVAITLGENCLLVAGLNDIAIGGDPTCRLSGHVTASAGKGGAALGVDGRLSWRVLDQGVTFALRSDVGPNGLLISGSLAAGVGLKLWGDFALTEAGILFGIDWEAIPSFGITCLASYQGPSQTVQLGATFLFDSTRPSRSVVAGSLTALSAADVVRIFTSENPDDAGLPKVVRDALAHLELKPVPVGRMQATPAVLGALANRELQPIYDAFAKACPGQRLSPPTGPDQVTPGAAPVPQLQLLPARAPAPGQGHPGRWFLTDMVRHRHYDLQLDVASGTIALGLQPQLYWCEEATHIGGIQFARGTLVAGIASILGWHTAVLIDIGEDGVVVDGVMDPLDFDLLFSLTARDGYQIKSQELKELVGDRKAGAALAIQTMTVGGVKPHAEIEGSLTILALTGAATIEWSEDEGFTFGIERGVAKAVSGGLTGHIHNVTDLPNLSFGIDKAELKVDLREWRPFGFDFAIPFMADLTASLTWSSGKGTIAGSFHLIVGSHDYGPFELHASLSIQQIKDFFGYVLDALATQLARAKDELARMFRDGVLPLAAGWGRALNVVEDEAVALLQLINRDVNFVAQQLRNGFNMVADEIAKLLSAAQYQGQVVMDALMTLFKDQSVVSAALHAAFPQLTLLEWGIQIAEWMAKELGFVTTTGPTGVGYQVG